MNNSSIFAWRSSNDLTKSTILSLNVFNLLNKPSITEETEDSRRHFTIIKKISNNYDESIIFYNKNQQIIIKDML